ncbi:hypothetical protein CCMA1212_002901 [Trichoderma ghanense]|uniref:Uncharacterized protein n=1 Tax=Trichoderma ghanense TaxID=65468 RepID=A0ABY2H9E0_9HYPO
MNQLPRTGDAESGPGAQIGLGSAGRRDFATTREGIEVGLDGRFGKSAVGRPGLCGRFGARGYDCKVQRRKRGERRWRSHRCPQITAYEISARLVCMPMTGTQVLVWCMKSRKYALSWGFQSPGTLILG